jgi:hypothetical protein
MSWGIDEIELAPFPCHSYWCELDSDSTFLLYIHGIEHLGIFHFSFFLGSSEFEHPVGQGRFTMVNMSDDAKITYLHAVYDKKNPEFASGG